MMFIDYYFVFLRRTSEFKQSSQKDLSDKSVGHFQFQLNQFKKDKLVLAGPLDGAGGIYLFKSNNLSKDQLHLFLEDDPLIKIKMFIPEVHKLSLPSIFRIEYSNINDLEDFYKELLSTFK